MGWVIPLAQPTPLTSPMHYKVPESALVVVYSKDQFLLLERSDRPGYWQSVTGSRDVHETIEQTAARELKEETGLTMADGVLISTGRTHTYPIMDEWRHRFAPDVSENRETVFYFSMPQVCNVTLSEHIRYEWVSGEEAVGRVFSRTNREEIQRILMTV
ncbi:MAG TPA: dihydroneopterin triphosphate diphosphatase [Leptospiraceae bacterium]|nr:dihydroneopterin triphosphate diphosphatase [Leptospiraceae bacterium]HQI19596.1 dihydroneopterin triphosphate diphosphatase [Leptospiraceae bacterium]